MRTIKKYVCINFQNDVKRLKHINEDLLKEMEIEKEKLHTLEAAMEDLQKQGNERNSE